MDMALDDLVQGDRGRGRGRGKGGGKKGGGKNYWSGAKASSNEDGGGGRGKGWRGKGGKAEKKESAKDDSKGEDAKLDMSLEEVIEKDGGKGKGKSKNKGKGDREDGERKGKGRGKGKNNWDNDSWGSSGGYKGGGGGYKGYNDSWSSKDNRSKGSKGYSKGGSSWGGGGGSKGSYFSTPDRSAAWNEHDDRDDDDDDDGWGGKGGSKRGSWSGAVGGSRGGKGDERQMGRVRSSDDGWQRVEQPRAPIREARRAHSPPRREMGRGSKREAADARAPPTKRGRAAEEPENSRSAKSVKVTNIPRDVNMQDIKDAFEQETGKIARCRIDRGTAWIAFLRASDARKAVETFDRGELNGATIGVALDH